jgi:hypothetical protein
MRRALMLLALVAGAARAQNPDNATLVGIRTVKVIVEHLGEHGIALGLDSVHLRTIIELRLREHGLRVSDIIGEYQGAVYLNAVTAALGSGPAALHVTLQFQQMVRVVRPPRPYDFATTWEVGDLDIGGSMETVRNQADTMVLDMVDQFLNTWLSVNPQK